MRDVLKLFYDYRSSTFLKAVDIRKKDFKIDYKLKKDTIRTLSEIHELGPRILFEAMVVLSQDFLSKQVLDSKDTFWRVWEVGRQSGHHDTSFGSKMFGHALYSGNDEGITPKNSDIISFDNYVLKTFWLDCPPSAFRGIPRDLKASWRKEYNTLIELSDKEENGLFVQIWRNDEGNVEEGKSFGIIDINVPEPFQETFGKTTRVGWIRMEKLNVFTGRSNNRVLEAVKALHSIGYTHNDLSHKNNVMVKGSKLVLIDFENAVKISEPKTEKDKKRIKEDVAAAKKLDETIFEFDFETAEVGSIGSPSRSWMSSPNPFSPYTPNTPPHTPTHTPTHSGGFTSPGETLYSTPQ